MIYLGFFRLGITNILMWATAYVFLLQYRALRRHAMPCQPNAEHCALLLAVAGFFIFWGLFYDIPLWIAPSDHNYYVVKSVIGFLTVFPVFACALHLWWKMRHQEH